jgi:hypothetical protein
VGINRETVRWYLRLRKPAISIAGSEEGADRKPAISITGKQAGDIQSKPAISIAGVRVGRRGRCERLAEVIGRDGACSKAFKAGTYRFKDLRRLLGGKRHA